MYSGLEMNTVSTRKLIIYCYFILISMIWSKIEFQIFGSGLKYSRVGIKSIIFWSEIGCFKKYATHPHPCVSRRKTNQMRDEFYSNYIPVVWYYMYDHQLSKERWKFDDQVLTVNLCCCHRQLAPFPVATCQPLSSLAAKCGKYLQAMINSLPLETKKVACGNTVILSPNVVTKAPSHHTQLIII